MILLRAGVNEKLEAAFDNTELARQM